jgi:hypothetical protein
MLVQVQEGGQFGTRDKLGMLLVTEDSINTYCENCEHGRVHASNDFNVSRHITQIISVLLLLTSASFAVN